MVFRKPTLFVVGAGASADFRLPVGSALTQQIAAAATYKLDNFGSPQNQDTQRLLDILRRKSQDTKQLNIWLNACRKISSGIHLKRSIDSYIDQHADEPEIAEMGKLLIAMRILNAEHGSLLFASEEKERVIDLKNGDVRASWIDQFAAMLFDGLRLSDLDQIGENIDIVCFNYDRCIEHYLAHALMVTYSITMTRAAALVQSINIIHPYGSLGPLASVAFGDTNWPDYWAIAANLKTFSESADSEVETQIEEAVSRAEQYVYLGLSFGRQNMQLLSLPDNEHLNCPKKQTYASGFGLYDQAVPQLARDIEAVYSRRDARLNRQSIWTDIEIGKKARELLDMHYYNIMAD